jgi:hypothetical protein
VSGWVGGERGTQQDVANASEFDRNVQTLDLMMTTEDREQTAQDRLATNATANLQTVWNSLQETGASFDSLSPDQGRSINEMEMPYLFWPRLGMRGPSGKVVGRRAAAQGCPATAMTAKLLHT